MQKELAKTIVDYILGADETEFSLIEVQIVFKSDERILRFHPWADKKDHVGVFKISVSDETYYIAFIDWQEEDNYYVVIFDSRRLGPLAELHKVQCETDGLDLCWTYKPTKRDKQNNLRKEYFQRCFGDTEVRIRMPKEASELDTFLQELVTLVKSRVRADKLIPVLDYREGFPEGKTLERLHKLKERSSKVTELAKHRAKERFGKLVCEVCKFDFAEYYGELGVDFIEAHHTIPVSELEENHVTRIEEIALVCCNCHQMLHRRRPWLNINELKKILKQP